MSVAAQDTGACTLGGGHESHQIGACCGALLRDKSGRFCKRPAGAGTDHVGAGPCKLHLGSTRNHRKAAHLKLAERAAAESLADEGYEPVTNPIEVLADVAGQARGWLARCASLVANIESYRYESDKSIEQLRAEVVLYERAMDRLARLVETLAKLGFEERRTELAESESRRVVAVMLLVAEGLFAAVREFVPADVPADVLDRARDEVPAMVKGAIEATAS